MPTLNWIGKDKVINHHLDVPYRVLEKQYTYNSDTDSENKIIHGDNLEALKSLLPEYEGRIKCIYIDPPYNTGNEGWVYNDNVNDPKIKKWLGEVVGKESEDLTRHDKWLCMMYPRLKLLHRLLADDGAIFISIDDNEQANLRLLCDEIFGGGNFITNIIWQKIHSTKNDAKYVSSNHDFILLYSKKIDFFSTNLLSRTEAMNARYKNPDNDSRGAWQSGDLVANEERKNGYYDLKSPTSGKIFNVPIGKHWVYSEENMLELIKDNRVWFGKDGNSFPRKKRFLNEVQQGKKADSIWFSENVGHNQEAKREVKFIFNEIDIPFATPKPVRLIDNILRLSTNKDSIILDSFAGSGTTAHAVLNLNKQDGGNRKFILVEMEDYADTITAERVRRVIDGYGEGKNAVKGTGGNFSYYKLGQPMFLENEYLNEDLPLTEIHRYVWYTETNQSYDESITEQTKYLLGTNEDTSYYFYYEKDSLTTLNYDFLKMIKNKSEVYIIYADNCSLSKEFLSKNNIIFKKIPRDISRF